MGLELVYAIHPFEAENDDEISFGFGESITVLEKDEMYGDGWWQGKNIHGKIGLFPMSYTSYINPLISSKTGEDEINKSYNKSTVTPIKILNNSDLELFRMPTPTIDETIDDIHDKLQKMSIKNEENNQIPIESIESIESKQSQLQQLQQLQQLKALSSKNVRNSKLLISPSSGSNSSNNSSRISSLKRSQRQSSENNTQIAPSPTELIVSSPTELIVSSSSEAIGNSRIECDSPTINNFEYHPLNWDVRQVCSWLEGKGFQNEITNFIENDITGDILLQLDLYTLKELNIISFGKRMHIMNAINELKSQFSIVGELGPDDDVSDIEARSERVISPVACSEPCQIYPQNLGYNNYLTSSNIESMNKVGDLNHEYLRNDVDSMKSIRNNYTFPSYYSNPLKIDFAEDSNIEIVNKKPRKIFKKWNSFKKSSKEKKNKIRAASAESKWELSHDEDDNENENDETTKKKTKKDKITKIKSVGGMHSSESEKIHGVASIGKKKKKIMESSTENQIGVFKRHSDNEKRNTSEKQVGKEQPIESLIDIDEEIMGATGEPDYEGWLKKQGTKYKTWKSRYCVLKGADFYYFKTDKIVNNPKIKGHIDLTGYRIIPDENILHGKYGFKLTHNSMRAHYFAHEDVEKMRGWMKAMMKATILRDNEAPIISSSNINTVSLVEAYKMAPRPPQPRRPSISVTAALAKISSPILPKSIVKTSTPPPYTMSSTSTMAPLEPLINSTAISPKIRPQFNNDNKF